MLRAKVGAWAGAAANAEAIFPDLGVRLTSVSKSYDVTMSYPCCCHLPGSGHHQAQ